MLGHACAASARGYGASGFASRAQNSTAAGAFQKTSKSGRVVHVHGRWLMMQTTSKTGVEGHNDMVETFKRLR